MAKSIKYSCSNQRSSKKTFEAISRFNSNELRFYLRRRLIKILVMLIVLTAFTSVLHIPSPLPEASATTVTGNIYYPITPIRVCDTRAVDSPYVTSNQCDLNGPETLTSNSTLNIQITGQASIPADATAVVANVTVTDTNSDGGYLSLYPSGATLPNTSNLNWNSGQTVSNLVTTAIGSNGSVAAYNQSGSADVIVDVSGYYGAASLNSSFGEYIPTTPSRICDTRPVNYVTIFQNQCDLTAIIHATT